MTILGFYQHPECSHEDPYWYMTTRLGTFLAVMDETEGCQNVPDVWGDVRVIKVERQDRKCKGKPLFTASVISSAAQR